MKQLAFPNRVYRRDFVSCWPFWFFLGFSIDIEHCFWSRGMYRKKYICEMHEITTEQTHHDESNPSIVSLAPQEDFEFHAPTQPLRPRSLPISMKPRTSAQHTRLINTAIHTSKMIVFLLFCFLYQIRNLQRLSSTVSVKPMSLTWINTQNTMNTKETASRVQTSKPSWKFCIQTRENCRFLLVC